MATQKKSVKPKALSPEETVRAITRTCRGPLAPDMAKLRDTALAKGNLAEARKWDAIRESCGYDVNDLIVKAGLDGEEHEKKCPKCGQLLTWRAPRFDKEER